MDNQEYQKNWQQLIMQGNSSHMAKNLGIDSHILDLYREFVWNHYTGSLEKMFPRLSDIWQVDWNEIAEMYFDSYPPKDWELNEMALSFPQFLFAKLDDLELPLYLAELAQYEVSEFLVYKSQVESAEGLTLNSTLIVHQFQYNIAEWVKRMDALERGGKIDELKVSIPHAQVSILFVCQNPSTRLCVFTSPSLFDIAIYVIMSQIELMADNVLEDLKAGIDQLVPAEYSANITVDAIGKSLHFLKQQCVII